MKKLGYKTAALALTDDSVSIDDPDLMQEEKLAVILGTEGDGLMQETMELCQRNARKAPKNKKPAGAGTPTSFRVTG